jgi:hypothetical protein
VACSPQANYLTVNSKLCYENSKEASDVADSLDKQPTQKKMNEVLTKYLQNSSHVHQQFTFI